MVLVDFLVLADKFKSIEHILVICLERKIFGHVFVNIFFGEVVLLFELESLKLLFGFLVEEVVHILSQLRGLLHSYLIILEQSEFALPHEGFTLPIVLSYVQNKELEDEFQRLD